MTSPNSDTRHTPGPWQATQNAYGCNFVQRWEPGEPHGLICGGNNHDTLLRADALLIAASPDLLAAGVEAEWFLAHYADYIATVPVDEIERHPYLPDLQEKLESLRAALAKATPENPS